MGVTEQGFPTFVPLRTEFKREGKRLIPVPKPLFERYIFAIIDLKKPGWGPISNTRGVSRILCNVDGNPIPVPNRGMHELRERDKKRDKKPRRVKNKFELGDRVRFHAGLWSGSFGYVMGYARGGVSVLTGPLSVTASEDDLTRIPYDEAKANPRKRAA
jgi:transcription antitermination factor NusG